MASQVCCVCSSPLFIELSPSSSVEDLPSSSSSRRAAVPDDVELGCGDHLHWECALEAFEGQGKNCPGCGKDVTSSDGRIRVIVRNEGGTTKDYDLTEATAGPPSPSLIRADLFFDSLYRSDADAVLKLIHGVPLDDTDQARAVAAEKVDVDAVCAGWEEPGLTALHLCAGADLSDMVELLLKNGADPNVRAKNGDVPLQSALKNGSARAAHVLQTAMSSSSSSS